MTPLRLAAALLAASLASSSLAADLRLGLHSSLGLGCQIAGVRAAVHEGRFGLYGQASACRSNVQGESGSAAFGAGLSFDLFRSGALTTYALLGADTQAGLTAAHAGLGVRYGLGVLPLEAQLEAGVQRVSTPLRPLVGPRVSLGVAYRFDVGPLQAGTPVSTPSAEASPTGGPAGRPESAPVSCTLTPEQDQAAASAAAMDAARRTLSAVASTYAIAYRDISYNVTPTGVSVQGQNATVTGQLRLSGTQRSNGEPFVGEWTGVVQLVREGCGWRATGYTQTGG